MTLPKVQSSGYFCKSSAANGQGRVPGERGQPTEYGSQGPGLISPRQLALEPLADTWVDGGPLMEAASPPQAGTQGHTCWASLEAAWLLEGSVESG